MIIANKHVFITPPRTGSTILHSLLCPPHTYVIGPQGFVGEECDKHTLHIPFHGEDKEIVFMVREPVERLSSLWRHYCLFHGHVEFDAFCHLVLDGRISWFYKYTLYDYYRVVKDKVNILLDIQNIPSFLFRHYSIIPPIRERKEILTPPSYMHDWLKNDKDLVSQART